MKKQKKLKKQVKISKFEKLLYVFTVILLLSFPLVIVFSQATLSKINYEVEKSKKEIASQEKKNESLVMKVNELTSFDKIKDVVSDMGLAYNNDNIVVISN